MGADIHIFAERKLSNGTWAMCKSYESQSSEQFYDYSDKLAKAEIGRLFPRARSRNYSFFADLAGVRGDGPDAKGVPNDISPLVREEYERWGMDAHSASWYSARDFVPIFMDNHMSEDERVKLVNDRLEGSGHYGIPYHVLETYLGIDIPYDDNDNPAIDSIRFVFWFDN